MSHSLLYSDFFVKPSVRPTYVPDSGVRSKDLSSVSPDQGGQRQKDSTAEIAPVSRQVN